MRGRIRSGDGSGGGGGGGGKRSGRRFGADERALGRLLGRSLSLSPSHTGRQAGNCISLSRLLCPAEQPPLSIRTNSPSTAAVEPLWWRTKPLAVVVWGKMGAMWWNGATVKYERREEGEGSSFLTF